MLSAFSGVWGQLIILNNVSDLGQGALFMRGMNAVHEEECSNPSAVSDLILTLSAIALQ